MPSRRRRIPRPTARAVSVDWEGFHCLAFAGQMIVSKVPVSFCLTINWNGPDDKVAAMMQAYIAGAADVLAETAQAVG